jgi:hypothetical protein
MNERINKKFNKDNFSSYAIRWKYEISLLMTEII